MLSALRHNLNKLQSYSLPSARYIDLTLGVSGTQYTAPADGWFDLRKSASNGQFIKIQCELECCVNSSGYIVSGFIPVRKNKKIQITYTASGTTHTFRFIYALGSAPQS